MKTYLLFMTMSLITMHAVKGVLGEMLIPSRRRARKNHRHQRRF